MKKHYEIENITFTLREKTTVLINSINEYGFEVKVAQFDFSDNGYKFYYDLKGKQKEVKRISTIINYLLKNGMPWWSVKEINQAKQNYKDIKKEEERQYKYELRQKDIKFLNDFIEGLNSYNPIYVDICNNVKNYDDETLLRIIKRTFKNPSKVMINHLFETIKKFNENN